MLQVLAAGIDNGCPEVGVEVVEAGGVQREVAQRLDRGAGVGDAAGAAGGAVRGVEAAADGEVAGREDQRAVAVGERRDAEVEAVAGGDDRGGAAFGMVVGDNRATSPITLLLPVPSAAALAMS